LAAGTARDRIPFARWILAPFPTILLWRRMVLWQITDYTLALASEARTRRARTLLRVQYGRRWRTCAPADLVWMLNAAPFADEACVQVDALTARSPERLHNGDSADLLARTIEINERHWEQHGRPVAAETVRKELRVSSHRARQLTRTARTKDRGAGEERPALADKPASTP
ncbi:hypothetical protein ACFQ1S_08880, partial [Kibdelosporangium lantanae]